ncbi:MAG: DUF3108 domain-containing protein [Spartobacteria bacterium]|nr:DUF3108 domain-containing protein [Spartobacteria bacterium]
MRELTVSLFTFSPLLTDRMYMSNYQHFILFRFFYVLFFVVIASTRNMATGAEPVDARSNGAAESLWFPVGEDLVYRIYWGFVPVGQCVVTTRYVDVDGYRYIRIRFRSRTNKILSSVYPVDDVLESLIEPGSFLPVRFTKNLKEGGYCAHEQTVFHHSDGTASWNSFLNENTKELMIEEDTRDLISFMYFMRKQSFQPGVDMEFRVMADEDIYDVFVHPIKYETVRLYGGDNVQSLKIEPKAAFDGLFVRKGSGWMWVSDDDQRLLTRMEASVPVANIKLILEEIRYNDPDSPDEYDLEHADTTTEIE